jgi:hypothetical protein
MDAWNVQYEKGYLKALIDIKNLFEARSDSMKHLRLNNSKGISRIMSAVIENRREFMESGGDSKIVILD